MQPVWWFLVGHAGVSLVACVALVTRTPPVERSVFAAELSAAFAQDARAATESFGGKRLLVWGRVGPVQHGASGQPFVEMRSSASSVPVVCELTRGSTRRVAAFGPEEHVALYGIAAGKVGEHVVLQQCAPARR